MYLSRVCLVLTIATISGIRNVCSEYGCKGQQFKNGHTSYEHYKNLMKIDTGYADNMKPEVLKREAIANPDKLRNAVDELHHQLLCSYTFDLFHYMYLLELLFSENCEKDLAELVLREDLEEVFLIKNCIEMLTVLYHLDMLDDMNPLWLVEMFVKYLNSIDNSELITRRQSIMKDHRDIFRILTDMHDKQNCQPQNWHNVKFGESEISKSFEALVLNPQNKIVGYIEAFKESIHSRYIKDFYITMNIDGSCQLYFSGGRLRLRSIWKEEEKVSRLLVDFAEITEWENTYAQIKNMNKKNKKFGSVKKYILNVSRSQSMFMHLLKLILFNNVWKQITLINLSLQQVDNEEQPHTVWQQWADGDESLGQIQFLNETMAYWVKCIIDYFNLKDDTRLVSLMSLIEMPPSSFTNVKFNKEKKEWLLEYIDEIHLQVFGKETKFEMSSSLMSSEYITHRLNVLKNLSDNYDIDTKYVRYKMKNNSIFESVLSTYLLYRFMIKGFFSGNTGVDMDFNVIRSFNGFSNEYFGSTSS